MNREPTVFLVDDDPTVRDALGLFLESAGMAVKPYASAQDFLAEYRTEWPGCVVLDIRMPGMTGLELQDFLKARNIKIPIIFLTGHGDVPMSVKAFKAGAVDFIEKPFNDHVLLARIREAIEQDSQTRTNQTRIDEVRRRYVQLTPREKEVMRLVACGHSNKKIARQLDISHRTIDVHRARLMEKMQAHSLSELVNMAAICDVL
jgi:two-component system, LuxR family, response regulator FixJ